MSEKASFISVHSNDISFYDLQQALSEDYSTIVFCPIDGEVKRGFQDVEWIMFMLMAIPVADSVINIVSALKDEVKNRVTKYMSSQKTSKRIRINVRIKLPFYSYEKEEEIFIDITEDKQGV